MESDHATESEQSGHEMLKKKTRNHQNIVKIFFGHEKKNPTKWYEQPPPATSTRRQNLLVKLPGLRGPSAALRDIASLIQVQN
ncbi:hypothetical protein JTB14_020130 [Gonioctena quinquepunctata]|nr:hypothetical protein JTB14_020130 [Gonioctena quinquepunctata]